MTIIRRPTDAKGRGTDLDGDARREVRADQLAADHTIGYHRENVSGCPTCARTIRLDDAVAQLVEDEGAWTVAKALRAVVLKRSAFLKEQGHAADPRNTTRWDEERRALAYLGHLLLDATERSEPPRAATPTRGGAS